MQSFDRLSLVELEHHVHLLKYKVGEKRRELYQEQENNRRLQEEHNKFRSQVERLEAKDYSVIAEIRGPPRNAQPSGQPVFPDKNDHSSARSSLNRSTATASVLGASIGFTESMAGTSTMKNSPIPTLPAPDELFGMDMGRNSIRLTWFQEDVLPTMKFDIKQEIRHDQKKPRTRFFETPIQLDKEEQSYDVIGLSYGKTYQMSVRVRDAVSGRVSAFSRVVDVVPQCDKSCQITITDFSPITPRNHSPNLQTATQDALEKTITGDSRFDASQKSSVNAPVSAGVDLVTTPSVNPVIHPSESLFKPLPPEDPKVETKQADERLFQPIKYEEPSVQPVKYEEPIKHKEVSPSKNGFKGITQHDIFYPHDMGLPGDMPSFDDMHRMTPRAASPRQKPPSPPMQRKQPSPPPVQQKPGSPPQQQKPPSPTEVTQEPIYEPVLQPETIFEERLTPQLAPQPVIQQQPVFQDRVAPDLAPPPAVQQRAVFQERLTPELAPPPAVQQRAVFQERLTPELAPPPVVQQAPVLEKQIPVQQQQPDLPQAAKATAERQEAMRQAPTPRDQVREILSQGVLASKSSMQPGQTEASTTGMATGMSKEGTNCYSDLEAYDDNAYLYAAMGETQPEKSQTPVSSAAAEIVSGFRKRMSKKDDVLPEEANLLKKGDALPSEEDVMQKENVLAKEVEPVAIQIVAQGVATQNDAQGVANQNDVQGTANLSGEADSKICSAKSQETSAKPKSQLKSPEKKTDKRKRNRGFADAYKVHKANQGKSKDSDEITGDDNTSKEASKERPEIRPSETRPSWKTKANSKVDSGLKKASPKSSTTSPATSKPSASPAGNAVSKPSGSPSGDAASNPTKIPPGNTAIKPASSPQQPGIPAPKAAGLLDVTGDSVRQELRDATNNSPSLPASPDLPPGFGNAGNAVSGFSSAKDSQEEMMQSTVSPSKIDPVVFGIPSGDPVPSANDVRPHLQKSGAPVPSATAVSTESPPHLQGTIFDWKPPAETAPQPDVTPASEPVGTAVATTSGATREDATPVSREQNTTPPKTETEDQYNSLEEAYCMSRGLGKILMRANAAKASQQPQQPLFDRAMIFQNKSDIDYFPTDDNKNNNSGTKSQTGGDQEWWMQRIQNDKREEMAELLQERDKFLQNRKDSDQISVGSGRTVEIYQDNITNDFIKKQNQKVMQTQPQSSESSKDVLMSPVLKLPSTDSDNLTATVTVNPTAKALGSRFVAPGNFVSDAITTNPQGKISQGNAVRRENTGPITTNVTSTVIASREVISREAANGVLDATVTVLPNSTVVSRGFGGSRPMIQPFTSSGKPQMALTAGPMIGTGATASVSSESSLMGTVTAFPNSTKVATLGAGRTTLGARGSFGIKPLTGAIATISPAPGSDILSGTVNALPKLIAPQAMLTNNPNFQDFMKSNPVPVTTNNHVDDTPGGYPQVNDNYPPAVPSSGGYQPAVPSGGGYRSVNNSYPPALAQTTGGGYPQSNSNYSPNKGGNGYGQSSSSYMSQHPALEYDKPTLDFGKGSEYGKGSSPIVASNSPKRKHENTYFAFDTPHNRSPKSNDMYRQADTYVLPPNYSTGRSSNPGNYSAQGGAYTFNANGHYPSAGGSTYGGSNYGAQSYGGGPSNALEYQYQHPPRYDAPPSPPISTSFGGSRCGSQPYQSSYPPAQPSYSSQPLGDSTDMSVKSIFPIAQPSTMHAGGEDTHKLIVILDIDEAGQEIRDEVRCRPSDNMQALAFEFLQRNGKKTTLFQEGLTKELRVLAQLGIREKTVDISDLI